ncbi:carboxylic acid reductase [Nocardia otitidiscaviarum]|uniref:Carboxylic acid reductase n=1 Tax=Nocardia otitidiscaviarum TaxID=1823 RepID=A0A516NPD0_9NOCA|nr:carboxylic acid reductase [Nocardia otitidiscaviarum]MCP9623967.1 carboxylic acid reductase [Nocardia otitidiscaviarum]QDP80757.1 carboxylic acid reductase [Nocardia otitidiscaviarum]
MLDDARAERRERRIADALADDQVREAVADAAVSESVRRVEVRLARIVDAVMSGYGDRAALAWRRSELVDGAVRLLPEYSTMTYRELWRRAGAVAAEWGADAESPVRAGDFVCTLGFTSPDYTVVDLALVRLGAVAVPLQASASVAQWRSIMAETEPRMLATSAETLPAAVEAVLGGFAPRRVLVFDYRPELEAHRSAVDSARERLAEVGCRVATVADAVDRGASLPAPLCIPSDRERLALLIYTSGSTGAPKGAMYTDRLAAGLWLSANDIRVPALTMNYMPLSHVAGRMSLYGTLMRGGTAYFAAASDMSTLLDDFGLARPTELFLVPRVCELLHQRYQSELDRRVLAGDDVETTATDVKAELRERVLGGRYLTALSGSAPLAAEMKTFMESLLDDELHDGYGSTEAGGSVLLDNRIKRPPVLDYRLVDVPELGYFRTDKPHPRGELLLKTESMFPGYYKRPEITAEMFDADGFYRTGDVVAELGPDQLVYVDRRNNVLKLSQGEFVTVAALEAVYATSPLIRQIFVYGSSERAYLLAVVVPTDEVLALPPARARAEVGESLHRIAKESGLQPYEIPREVLIESEPFTIDNGLLSGIGKLLRPKLKEHYGEQLERLYTELAQQREDELTTLRRGAHERPVLETVTRAAGAVLDLAAGEVSPDAHFADLGGDSLSALSFSTLLRDIFGVEVPVGVIVGPATDLTRIAEYLVAERDSGTRPTAATVHGDDGLLRADDLTLEAFLDPGTLAAATRLSAPTDPPRTVLLTGANGYLGRFLALEWLQRLDVSGGTLICLVRGSDADAARRRLDAVFATGDPELEAHYRDLAGRRLRVLAGDIGEPNLGLSEQDWRDLAESVDVIVHPAALVNHVLPYAQLFGPNVVGTAEVIRLALTARLKPVTYLSTVAVSAGIDPETFTEDGDIREISPVRRLDDGYANGYGNSKWAGEVLLRAAHDRFGLPVAVFRSDMILAHSHYAGQLNVPDMFTRLLLSVLATGLAPGSFHDAHGERHRAHYDGLPADFTAAAVTTLGAQATSGFDTYDVLNPHDDGLSLDTFIDWLIDSGHPIDRIDDYADWFTRFETAVRALPEPQRQHSLLPLLHAYRHPTPPLRGAALPAKHFRAAVQQAKLGPDADIPHLTRELIEKYVSDLRLLGLLG